MSRLAVVLLLAIGCTSVQDVRPSRLPALIAREQPRSPEVTAEVAGRARVFPRGQALRIDGEALYLGDPSETTRVPLSQVTEVRVKRRGVAAIAQGGLLGLLGGFVVGVVAGSALGNNLHGASCEGECSGRRIPLPLVGGAVVGGVGLVVGGVIGVAVGSTTIYRVRRAKPGRRDATVHVTPAGVGLSVPF